MALVAKRDQVLFRIVAGMAAEVLMMDLKIFSRAAELAAPAVPPQNSLA